MLSVVIFLNTFSNTHKAFYVDVPHIISVSPTVGVRKAALVTSSQFQIGWEGKPGGSCRATLLLTGALAADQEAWHTEQCPHPNPCNLRLCHFRGQQELCRCVEDEMKQLSELFRWAQCKHNGPFKREAGGGSEWQKRMWWCKQGSEWCVLEPRHVGSLSSWKRQRTDSPLEPPEAQLASS